MRLLALALSFALPIFVLGSCSGGGSNDPPAAPANTAAAVFHAPDLVDNTWTHDLSWDAAVDPDSTYHEYYVEIYRDSVFHDPFDFASATAVLVKSSGWITALTYHADMLPSTESSGGMVPYLGFRVKARDGDHDESPFAPHPPPFGSNSPPSTPTNLAAVVFHSPDATDNTWTYDLSWDASIDLEGEALEYYVEVYKDGVYHNPFDFNSATASFVKTSGWITALTYRADMLPSYQSSGNVETNLGFRVKARDPHAESGWAEHATPFGSCPFLFAWNGNNFAFESDVFPQGRMGTVIQNQYARPFPEDYYGLVNTLAPLDGAYVLQLTSEREEVDYLDQVSLYAMYVPEGLVAYSEKPTLNATTFDGLAAFHTTAFPLQTPLSAIHVNTGTDVASEVSAMDREYLRLNNDPNHSVHQTVELDFGDLSAAPMVKLIVDGRSQFPTTAEGSAFINAQGPRTKVEVIGPDGSWELVPISSLVMSPLPAFRRPILLDMTGLFPTNDYRIRLTWVNKTYLDAVLLDTTADEPIQFVELPLMTADLHYRGVSGITADEVYDLVYDAVKPSSFKLFPGAYTKFGDVTPLLTEVDDKFAISFGGDELTLRFETAPQPGAGLALSFVLKTYGYYKDKRIDLPLTVDPLPFAAMSTYPYPAGEHYPDDPDHDAYRAVWNTRTAP